MKPKFNSILLSVVVLIYTSCTTDMENQIITEKRKNDEGIRTIGYPKEFKNKESYSIYLKALECVRIDDYICCKEHLEEALSMDPDNPIIVKDLGLAETRLYNYDKASELLQRAIELDSNFYEAYCNLGLTYYYDDQFTKGIQVLKLVPVDSTNRIERGSLYYHLFMNYAQLKKCDSAFHYYNLIHEFATNEIFLENVERFKENVFKKNCPQ